MPRRSEGMLIDPIVLEPESRVPLYRQLCSELRRAVYGGQIKPGARLPSTRVLAEELGLSRTTIRDAFDQLLSEGLIESRPGSGTYISTDISEAMRIRNQIPREPDHAPSNQASQISSRGQQISDLPVFLMTEMPYFVPNIAGDDLFPRNLWAQLNARHWRKAEGTALSCLAEAGGNGYLKETIATYLKFARGMECDPDQILITAGNTHSLGLLMRLLLDRSDTLWVEEPTSLSNISIMQAFGVDTHPVQVDETGLSVTDGLASAPGAKAAYITPSRQYPLGQVMSVSRRLELLNWAERNGSWIIEDDYDSEFRYTGRPLPTLFSADRAGCVVYMNSFGKVFGRGLRLGFIVVPKPLIRGFTKLLHIESVVPEITQLAMADFIAEGHFMSHVRQIRQVYSQRQAHLVTLLLDAFGDQVSITGTSSGLHIILWLPDDYDDDRIYRTGLEQGLLTYPLKSFMQRPDSAPDHLKKKAIVLGFASMTKDECTEAVSRLIRIIQDCRDV